MNSQQKSLLPAASHLHLWFGHFCILGTKRVFSWRHACQRGLINTKGKGFWNIVTRYCSGYGSLQSKFFLSEKLRWRFNLDCSSLIFFPIHFGYLSPIDQLIPHFPPTISRMSGLFALITSLVMFTVCHLLITRQRVPLAMSLTFRTKWSFEVFGLTTFFRISSPSEILLLILLRSTVWFFYLVCHKNQFSICDILRDKGNNICDCYIFFILRSIFFLFK